MKKLSLQAKVGALMMLAIMLISATGYLSYRSLSAIVSSIQATSKPDLRLLLIREISNDFEKAENSVRMFVHTRDQKDIEPYYATIARFDGKIEGLRVASRNDTMMLIQIDTISKLIEEDMLIWNDMLDLYHNDSLDSYIRKLTARLAVETLSKKNTDKSILQRVFSKRDENKQVQADIIRDLHEIEKKDSIQNKRLLAVESHLALTGKEIRNRFNILISKMEDEVVDSINRNAKAADRLAIKTYRWLTMFTLLSTLLVILVLVIVVRYVRKTRDYQIALIKSKNETEKLARTRELFMANMSHEIRTPVNAIYGFTEQLMYTLFDAKSRKILGIIKSSSDHLVNIVNNILDFSKLQQAKIVLHKTHFQISRVFEEVQLLFENKTREINTRLFYTISKSTPGVLLGDSYRLKQILINLVGNAVKFTNEGEIHFSVDCEMKSGETLDLILKVTDTGIGISDDLQERVFDDFTQAESDINRKYGGTGLGLSIVKKLVELHQGTITLKSQKSKGTTITCILPYAVGNAQQLQSITQPLHIPERIRSLRILIVDDEEYNRMLFRTILERWNVRYDEAGDGQKAVDMIKITHYDMVFMDIRMPGLDGLKATTFIRNELKRNPDELPVIGISATQNAEDLREYELSGMNTFLIKPFTEKVLLEIITSVLEPVTNSSIPEITVYGRPLNVNPKVNLSNLYHLADHDMPFVKQMLIRFIESTEKGLHEIQHAVEAENFEAAIETAHKLAAPCRHVGADDLYSLMKGIEHEGLNNKNRTLINRLYEDSGREFAEIKKILNSHIEKMGEQ